MSLGYVYQLVKAKSYLQLFTNLQVEPGVMQTSLSFLAFDIILYWQVM